MSEPVDRVLTLLRRLDAAREPNERAELAEKSMVAVFALGMAVLSQEVSEDEVRALAAAGEPLLIRVTGALEIVAGSIEDRFMLTWDQDGWEDLSRLRSALEFLLELFPGQADWVRSHVRPNAYDDLIRRRSHDFGYLRPSEIPPGIPTSHWWWWAPLEPNEEPDSGASRPR
jgi:hypothetical protein